MTAIVIANENFEQVAVIDVIESLVWVERYSEAGEFELVIPLDSFNKIYLIPGYYLLIPESDFIMVIEDIQPKEDDEEGNKLTVKGSSSEALLKHRVLLAPYHIDGNVQTSFIELLELNFINPVNIKRKVGKFQYQLDVSMSSMVYSLSNLYSTGTVYDAIHDACASLGIGFRLYLSEDRKLTFVTYDGVNRSHLQTANPRVVFSKTYDNVISTTYYLSTAGNKNLVLVITEDVDPSLKRVEVYAGSEPEGLNRRETFLEITTPREVEGAPELTIEQTLDIIRQQGLDELHTLRPYGIFDGEFDTDGVFVYREDFFLGDIVVCIIDDVAVPARIIERVFSVNSEGTSNLISFDFDL